MKMSEKEITSLMTGYVRRIERRLDESPDYLSDHGAAFLLGNGRGSAAVSVRGSSQALAAAFAKALADDPALLGAVLDALGLRPEGRGDAPAAEGGQDAPKPRRPRKNKPGGED